MDYGENLYKFRKKNSLSQETVANELSVSRQSVSLWETNQSSPSMENLIALAKLYQVSLDELVGVKNESKPIYSSTSIIDETATFPSLDKGNYERITFILGIFGVLLVFIDYIGVLPFAHLGAIVLGFIGIKLVKKDQDDQRSYSKPGYVLSIVSLFTGVMSLILAIFLITIFK